MTRIACLHTAESNVAVFDAARLTAGLAGVTLRHSLRADLLAEAEQAGGLTPDIAARTIQALQALCGDADAVLLTCSTLGPAAEAATAAIPILRVDAALAAEATRGGGTLTILCAAPTTIEPTRRLFEAAAQATGAELRVELVPGAWAAFKAGQHDRYLAMIAQAAIAARRAGADRVALAQASMAGASALVAAGDRPLNSPLAGLIAAARVAATQKITISPPHPTGETAMPQLPARRRLILAALMTPALARAQGAVPGLAPTPSMRGGANNYLPGAPIVPRIGNGGFWMTGTVRRAGDGAPLPNIRIQIWAHTTEGREHEPHSHGATLTGPNGVFRLEMPQIVPTFGQPHGHLAYEGAGFQTVFLRPILPSARDTSLSAHFVLLPA